MRNVVLELFFLQLAVAFTTSFYLFHMKMLVISSRMNLLSLQPKLILVAYIKKLILEEAIIYHHWTATLWDREVFIAWGGHINTLSFPNQAETTALQRFHVLTVDFIKYVSFFLILHCITVCHYLFWAITKTHFICMFINHLVELLKLP